MPPGSVAVCFVTAQGRKLPIQALVDKVTQWCVPVVIGAAALANAVAILITACPCALALAAPVSIRVGTGRGTELGILFRKGGALQGVGVVALDKTGTSADEKHLAKAQVAARIAEMQAMLRHGSTPARAMTGRIARS